MAKGQERRTREARWRIMMHVVVNRVSHWLLKHVDFWVYSDSCLPRRNIWFRAIRLSFM